MISDSTIDEMRKAMPNVLHYYGVIDLRRPFTCLNPCHEDRHPSMSYDPRTNRVTCFSCGFSGDTFDVVGAQENIVNFSDKAKFISSITGITLDESDNQIPLRKWEPIKPTYGKPEIIGGMDVCEIVQYACNLLLQDRRAAAALELMHKRGFTDEMIVDYCIGWVPHPTKVFPAFGYAPQYADGYICIPFPENGNLGTGKDFCAVRRCTFRPVMRGGNND